MHLWIEGTSRSGKTQRAINHWRDRPGRMLVLTVSAQRRRQLLEQWQGSGIIQPWQGFVQEQVLLFFPLLIKVAGLGGRLPIVLRVETEQSLARQLWAGSEGIFESNREKMVRRLLDLYLLAVSSGRQLEEIGDIVERGSLVAPAIVPLMDNLRRWRDFCWRYSLLTYGVMGDLFAHYLMPHPQFQAHCQQFSQLWIDGADEMPAIAYHFCRQVMAQGTEVVITYNTDGEARSGLGADAPIWQGVRAECEVVSLPTPSDGLEAQYGQVVRQTVFDPAFASSSPDLPFYTIETITRGKLFRTTAEFIAEAISSNLIQPQEVAIIAPGIEAIARYAFTEIFSARKIPILPMDNQRPLNQSPQVRALLTLLALTYRGLGRMISPTDIGEMLTVLAPDIDPVRAGLLAEYCFSPDTDQPRLQPSQTYADWDRLGYRASSAYEELRTWLAGQSHPLPPPLLLLDRAIQFFYQRQALDYSQVMPLRELMETAQHYWEVSLRLADQLGSDPHSALERFITEMRLGTATANPYPTHPPQTGITISNIFQYRINRGCHRWQFWLDISSDFWLEGGAAVLYGAPLFRSDWSGKVWTPIDEANFNQQRLKRILTDLLCRCTERVYLCHSELSTQGQLQAGILQTLLDIARPAQMLA